MFVLDAIYDIYFYVISSGITIMHSSLFEKN